MTRKRFHASGAPRAPRTARTTPPRRALCVLAAILVAGAAFVPAAHAAGSGIAGRVYSTETGDPLGYANVVYFRTDGDATGGTPTARGTIADGEGTYRVECEPGTYRVRAQFIAFAAIEVEDVVVKAGEYAVIDLGLTPEAIRMETIHVTAEVVRNTDTALLTKQKKAVAVSDGISARQIARSSDSNAAEVANRVTGVSVVGSKYVFVRGLGERYSTVQLNGAGVGSPEPNRRVLPLDIFPAGLLDNMVVQKTYTPDQPGEFGGGVVNVSTVEFPGERSWSLGISSGRREGTTGADFLTYPGGKDDWLGFDDGTRGLPDLIEQIAPDKAITRQSVVNTDGQTVEEISEIGKSFRDVWAPTTENGEPSLSGSFSYGDRIGILGQPVGLVASGSLGNSRASYENYTKRNYKNASADGTLTINNDFVANRFDRSTSLGGLVSLGTRVAERNRISLRALYTRTSDDQVLLQEGETEEARRRTTRLLYTERGLLSLQGGSEHPVPFLAGSTFDWNFSYSEAERNQPDGRSYSYELYQRTDAWGRPFERWEASRRNGEFFTRSWEWSDDYERNWSANWSVPFRSWNGLEAKAKAGFALQNKDRRTVARRFQYKPPAGVNSILADSLWLPPDQLLTDEHIGGQPLDGLFYLEEATRPNDGHLARFDDTAWYGMVSLPLSRRLRLVTGARVEDWKQSVISANPVSRLIAEPDTATLAKTDVLPSVNLNFQLVENANLRFAWSRTINRPDLRELSTQDYLETDRDRKVRGNPDLRRALMDSWDFRAEWYPAPGELIAVSTFLKDFSDPIEYEVFGETGASRLLYRPVNATSATLKGLEMETRFGLGRLTSALDRFGMMMNLTLIDSKAEIPESDYASADSHALQGQSPYVVNTGLFFQSASGRTDVGLLYNVFGKRLDAVQLPPLPTGNGTEPIGLPDIYEQPFHSLDLTFTQRFPGAKLKFAFENILDDEILYTQGSYVVEERRRGRTLSLSIGTGS